MKKSFVLFVFCFLFSMSSKAKIILVPGDQPNIQAGIDAAENGDTVLVADGTYLGLGNKNLDFNGKSITVASENGPDNCIIDCEADGRGFYFHNSETSNSILMGFTIQNGDTTDGGGIFCSASSPTIHDCILISNNGQTFGGALFCESGSETLISFCIFQNNYAIFGGGIYTSGASPGIYNCHFYQNSGRDYGGALCFQNISNPTVGNCIIVENNSIDLYGGGIYAAGNSGPIIKNCTIYNNNAVQYGGGLYCTNHADVTVIHSIFWNNHATTGHEIALRDASNPSTLHISFCDIEGDIGEIYVETYCDLDTSGGGLIATDPLFVSGVQGCYYLSHELTGQPSDSPCINAGNDYAHNLYVFGHSGLIPMSELTTRIDHVGDSSILDLGFHYPIISPTPTQTPPPPTQTSIPTATPVPPTATPTVPTGVPTYTAVPTNTPVPPTSTQNPPTQTPVPTATEFPPTSTPDCYALGCQVYMPRNDFGAGDECFCDVYICNPDYTTYQNIPVFAILDVYGLYFFAPSFGDFDFYIKDIVPGRTKIIVLQSFPWPAHVGEASGILWYAAMTDPEITQLFGELGTFEFGWHEEGPATCTPTPTITPIAPTHTPHNPTHTPAMPSPPPSATPAPPTATPTPWLDCSNMTDKEYLGILPGHCSDVEDSYLGSVRNTGGSSLELLVDLTASGCGEFQLCPGFPVQFTLEEDQTQDICIQFCPQNTGEEWCIVKIQPVNTQQEPCERSLHGTTQ